MSDCFENTAVLGCFNNGGVPTPAVIHYTYDQAGAPSVRITDTSGAVLAGADLTNTVPGLCDMKDAEMVTECYRLTADTAFGAAGEIIYRRTIAVIDPTTWMYDPALSKNIYTNATQGTILWIHTLTGVTILGTPFSFADLIPCEQEQPLIVTGGGAQIAGPVRAGTAAFSGAADTWTTSSIVGAVQSVTVSARGVTDGLVGQTANQVVLYLPDGTSIAMMNGETRTFSVVHDQDEKLYTDYNVRAFGNAYANITYTFI